MSTLRERIRLYHKLTKPGIVRGNAIHTLAGALFAASWVPHWSPIIGVLAGTSFVIASACIVNNYLDRKIDVKMSRTKHRGSATGEIPLRSGLALAVVLLIIGFAILQLFTNMFVVLIGVIAYI